MSCSDILRGCHLMLVYGYALFVRSGNRRLTKLITTLYGSPARTYYTRVIVYLTERSICSIHSGVVKWNLPYFLPYYAIWIRKRIHVLEPLECRLLWLRIIWFPFFLEMCKFKGELIKHTDNHLTSHFTYNVHIRKSLGANIYFWCGKCT